MGVPAAAKAEAADKEKAAKAEEEAKAKVVAAAPEAAAPIPDAAAKATQGKLALKGPPVKQKLLKLHALSKARTSKLAMMDGEDAAALSTRGLASGGVACAVSLGAK